MSKRKFCREKQKEPTHIYASSFCCILRAGSENHLHLYRMIFLPAPCFVSFFTDSLPRFCSERHQAAQILDQLVNICTQLNPHCEDGL